MPDKWWLGILFQFWSWFLLCFTSDLCHPVNCSLFQCGLGPVSPSERQNITKLAFTVCQCKHMQHVCKIRILQKQWRANTFLRTVWWYCVDGRPICFTNVCAAISSSSVVSWPNTFYWRQQYNTQQVITVDKTWMQYATSKLISYWDKRWLCWHHLKHLSGEKAFQ